jgi:long-chain acyl-CoA synthetase
MMQRLLQRLGEHARERAPLPALADDTSSFDFEHLHAAVTELAGQLSGSRIGLLMDNSCAWAVCDLAIAASGAVCIPVPPFFSPAQMAHLIADAGIDTLLSDQLQAVAAMAGAPGETLEVAGRAIGVFRLPVGERKPLPPGTAKITYTSGTTGQPKGVCITGEAIERVSISLASTVEGTLADRSLSLLPLSTLLENIGGLYAPLYVGSRAAVPSLASCGFEGSSRVRPDAFIGAFYRFTPTTVILVPQLLKLLVETLSAGATLPDTLRFVAVGGAPTSEALVGRAWSLGLPVYEGYGLSEATSVVCMNRPTDIRIGSVGRPLPHVSVRIARDGEIMVAGDLFAGYLGDTAIVDEEWATGDIGFFDADGYLHVTGRKKTAYATAYGRNVSPEWVESELTGQAVIVQAAVFGEGRAANVALVVPRPDATRAQVEAAVMSANARLPDYARVHAWRTADDAFTPANGLASRTGGLDRRAIEAHYTHVLENLYAGHHDAVRS